MKTGHANFYCFPGGHELPNFHNISKPGVIDLTIVIRVVCSCWGLSAAAGGSTAPIFISILMVFKYFFGGFSRIT